MLCSHGAGIVIVNLVRNCNPAMFRRSRSGISTHIWRFLPRGATTRVTRGLRI